MCTVSKLLPFGSLQSNPCHLGDEKQERKSLDISISSAFVPCLVNPPSHLPSLTCSKSETFSAEAGFGKRECCFIFCSHFDSLFFRPTRGRARRRSAAALQCHYRFGVDVMREDLCDERDCSSPANNDLTFARKIAAPM